MRWLIVEDALKDRKGHWLEWVSTFQRGFRELGDEVVVLADSQADPEILHGLNAEPILPPSIWHRFGDGAGALTRYSRVFTHSWQTWRVMRKYLRHHRDFDAIFVPTVSVHHLLAWSRLIKHTLRHHQTRVLLFFLAAPIQVESNGKVVADGSPTAHLLIRLIKGLEAKVRTGQVVLGVETEAMRQGFEAITGVPFKLLPQPVSAMEGGSANRNGRGIRMACYGAARAEKGSDILQDAILIHRRRFPQSRTQFAVQWIEDFTANGALITKNVELLKDPNVQFLTRYFADGEYAEHLKQTDVMLLPYRASSYQLRGSRVVTEAATAGIPVIATRGTTLARAAGDHGAGLWCEDGNPESLASAIKAMEDRFEEQAAQAMARRAAAREFFSIASFRSCFSASESGEFSIAARAPKTFSLQET
jgi:glycosyltransferase involved in cell wall biosynthesis